MLVAPDGEILASGSTDRPIKLWRVSDGSLIRTLPSPTLPPRWRKCHPRKVIGSVFCMTYVLW